MFELEPAEEVLERVADACAIRDAGFRVAALAVAEAVGREAFRAAGAVRAQSWLRAYTESSRDEAGRIVRLGRFLARHPVSREALVSGRLPVGRVEVIASAVTAAREAHFGEAEPVLLAQAERVHRVEDLERVVAHWCALVDQDVEPPGEPAAQRLAVHDRLDGGAHLAGRLDAPTAQALHSALDAFDTGPDAKDGPLPARTLSERRADALGDLARAATHVPERDDVEETVQPRRRAERTTTLVIDLPSLAGRAHNDLDGITAVVDGRPVPVWAVEQLLCDSWVAAAVTDASGAILHATDRTPDFTSSQRRLIAARDRGCVFPGCDAPPSWTDAHHLHWRSEGGGRSLDNAASLCRRHHTLLHLPRPQRWQIERIGDGTWQATSPTGTTWTGRPPPRTRRQAAVGRASPPQPTPA